MSDYISWCDASSWGSEVKESVCRDIKYYGVSENVGIYDRGSLGEHVLIRCATQVPYKTGVISTNVYAKFEIQHILFNRYHIPWFFRVEGLTGGRVVDDRGTSTAGLV